ncbi:transmembrane protease serine 11B-like protein isoform X2 [Heptranchias perlo]|uniref:transmembrane protease serine 11B-like protein isoform X2 n=1 Tax=Heptranchias perlo TaxID=212740 RepID=UPI00355AC290
MKISKGIVITLVVIFVIVVLVIVAALLLAFLLPRASSSSDVYYNGNFRILNVPYNANLATRNSAAFSTLANIIETHIENVYSSSNLSTQFNNLQVVEFRSGSVRVVLLQQFKADGSTSVTARTVAETFRQSLVQVNVSSQTGSLDRFSVDLTSIQFTEISQAQAEALSSNVSPTTLVVSNPNATAAMDTPTTRSSTGTFTISPTTLVVSNPNATAAMDTPTTRSSTGMFTISVSTLSNLSATTASTIPDVHTLTVNSSDAAAAPTTVIATLTTRNTVSKPTCGSRPGISSRIVGGTNSMDGEWPWQVSLQIGSHVCGASIISDSTQSLWKAYMGSVDVGKGTIRNIKRIIRHPNYARKTQNDFDIAVLELSSPLTFSNVIQPVCLPSSSQVFPAGRSCTITGWGALVYQGSLSGILQKADVNIIEDSTCRRIYSPFITNRMLCAGLLRGGVDSCQGDSGGPLVCVESDGTWFLAGIVSFGFECAKPNFPGVYSRVTVLRDWVKQQTGV